ncbi:MAG: hypothetical protein E3J86_06425 [Candidatus Thorarchaeota archaeon]|nr:MAG: hypothetical protein E3J86_06425 [Candidatus Thorarchaeota archaeon]
MDDLVDVFESFRIEFTNLYRKLIREFYKDCDFSKYVNLTPDKVRNDMDSKRNMASRRLDMFLSGLVWFNRTLEVLRNSDETVRIIFRGSERREALLRFINEFKKFKAFNLDVYFSPLQDDVEDDFSKTLKRILTYSRPLTEWMRAPFSVDRNFHSPHC